MLLGPHPPSPRDVAALVSALGLRDAQRAARTALRPARDVAEEVFSTERARGFFAGHSAHSMLPLERRPSAGFGMSLCVLGNALGWPFARGGSQRIADGLVRELERLGGEVRVGDPVDVLPGRTSCSRTSCRASSSGSPAAGCPERYERQLRAYRHGPGAFKLDWALSEPIPWRDEDCRRAGTVHLGATLDEISASEWRAWVGRPPERPFVLLAQPSVFDDSRAPAGRQTAWAYCHVPNGWDGDATERDRGAGGALRARLPRRGDLARSVIGAARLRAPRPQPRRRRRERGRDGPRPAPHAPGRSASSPTGRRSTASTCARPRRRPAAASTACAASARHGWPCATCPGAANRACGSEPQSSGPRRGRRADRKSSVAQSH